MQILFANPTLTVAAIFGLVAVLVGWKRPFVVLSALVLLIPFRDFTTRWLNAHTELPIQEVTAIGRWWSGVVLALLLVTGSRWLIERINDRKLPRPGMLDITLALAITLAIGAALTSPNRIAGLISLRGYLQSIPVYFLARLIVPSMREVRSLLPLWLAVGAIISVFGVAQALTWDEAIYRAEEYTRRDGQLVVPPTGIMGEDSLRPASTVSGPNEFGVDMVVVITIVLFWLLASSNLWSGLLAVLGILFAAGLIVSVSRSAVLALTAAATTTLIMRWNELRTRLNELNPRMGVSLVAVGALAFAAAAIVLSSTGLPGRLVGTVRTLSEQYHYIDTVEAIQFLIAHPEGAGMGMVRPKAALEALDLQNVYHVEGSILQIGVEMGIWGLLAWGVFIALALNRVVRNRGELSAKELRILSGSAAVSWIAALVAFAILPLMQSISLMIWLWFLLGIGVNSATIQRAWNQSQA